MAIGPAVTEAIRNNDAIRIRHTFLAEDTHTIIDHSYIRNGEPVVLFFRSTSWIILKKIV
jgi:hypothetical protein